RLPLRGGIISVEDVEVEPVPRLYLQEVGGDLRATLAFGYGEYEVEADPRAKPVKMIGRPESWSLIYLHRRLDRERYYYQLLTDPRYGLKRAGRGFGPAVFRLRARTHPLDFLMDCIPHLTEAGFEVYGEEKLRSVRLRRVSPTLRVAVSSGIDWFDIQAVVAYGDQTVPLREVLRAVRKGRRFVKLADGSFGRIPEEWLERYRHLFAFAENTEEGFRVRHVHLSLLDELLDDAAEVEAPPDLEERRQRLRSFDRITPQPVPKGFRGELRPYQKAGLDWLHFLHDYGFGGILADDMGLGKTIQVLAFLQSLKERGEAEHASLLVVPKSLLTNWQREAARFTPALRVLPFVGKDRKKDTAFFDQYDIVLTTYGTMLRDIQFLRSYRFHYAILDESQAIKNPLAKTAQAARRLNADHRLAVTGTPVENTTFELWSQFAFVLPGLLGGLEFFRKEFAIPIERGGDKGAAARLRRLVFPFILRRTKDQVAPELPPRTERLLFADLTPAQRSLYSRYRDRYRAEVLGLIDRQGINSARMKILEGLLRLRQICLHPALVEPTFRGKAGKFDVLFEVLETLLAERHKVLIYSQFVKVLHLVRERLDQSGAPYAYLDGRTRDRHAQVDRFQNDPDVPFFLISLRAGGLGLNLTAADYVILLDPWWNPAVEAQAADRVHRIGQDKPVFVYKLIAKDTVEEKILELQERKRKLVADLITTERGFAKSLTREDVEVLFG
ncbi:MAG TPA: serine/threonine protein kinase, partial [Chloroflexi bacterium]|nr:serine/threonine protein kinase [Chloroflexota bacterium]